MGDPLGRNLVDLVVRAVEGALESRGKAAALSVHRRSDLGGRCCSPGALHCFFFCSREKCMNPHPAIADGALDAGIEGDADVSFRASSDRANRAAGTAAVGADAAVRSSQEQRTRSRSSWGQTLAALQQQQAQQGRALAAAAAGGGAPSTVDDSLYRLREPAPVRLGLPGRREIFADRIKAVSDRIEVRHCSFPALRVMCAIENCAETRDLNRFPLQERLELARRLLDSANRHSTDLSSDISIEAPSPANRRPGSPPTPDAPLSPARVSVDRASVADYAAYLRESLDKSIAALAKPLPVTAATAVAATPAGGGGLLGTLLQPASVREVLLASAPEDGASVPETPEPPVTFQPVPPGPEPPADWRPEGMPRVQLWRPEQEVDGGRWRRLGTLGGPLSASSWGSYPSESRQEADDEEEGSGDGSFAFDPAASQQQQQEQHQQQRRRRQGVMDRLGRFGTRRRSDRPRPGDPGVPAGLGISSSLSRSDESSDDASLDLEGLFPAERVSAAAGGARGRRHRPAPANAGALEESELEAALAGMSVDEAALERGQRELARVLGGLEYEPGLPESVLGYRPPAIYRDY